MHTQWLLIIIYKKIFGSKRNAKRSHFLPSHTKVTKMNTNGAPECQCRNFDAYLLRKAYPPIWACISCLSAMVPLFLNLKEALYHSPLELKIIMNSNHTMRIWAYVLPLPVLSSGESNLCPWLWIKSRRYQHVKWNVRWTRPCQGALHPFILPW